MTLFLGLDLGTGSTKALLIDGNGDVAAQASAAYQPSSPQPGWSEMDVEAWWQAVLACAAQLPPELRRAVAGIGLSGQMHGVVLSDAAGQALRPAILWLDNRAAKALGPYPADSLARLGNPLSPGMAGPVLCWLKAHEPGTLAAARWALQPKDWLRLRLTGSAGAEPSDASGTLLADRHGRWDLDLVDRLGIPPSLLAPLGDSAGTAGLLCASAAAALGLPAGIPVAAGGGDTPMAALGSGLLAHNMAQLTTGSGAQIVVMQSRLPPVSPVLNSFRAVNPGHLPGWYVMAAMQNAGVALEWARNTLGLSWAEAYARAFEARPVQDGGILFLPYLSGERTPWMNPRLRGAWIGMDPGSTPGQLMRAAFLGVAYSVRAGVDALRAHGIPFDSLRLAGGGSVHAAWRQLLMDVLQLPLDAVACPNASARGAAMLGGMAAAHWGVADFSAMAPPSARLGEPQSLRHEDGYHHFCQLGRLMAGWFDSKEQP
jgi:xylulokinase